MAEELAGGVEVGAQCKHHGGEGVAGSMEGDVFVDGQVTIDEGLMKTCLEYREIGRGGIG